MSLLLRDSKPLAQGGVRLIYPHPDNPGWLVKVMRPDKVAALATRFPAKLRNRRRLGPYIQFSREINEYMAACFCSGECLPFLQKVIGLIDTDMGLGLVVEAARGRDNQLGMTIDDLWKTDRFDETAQRALARFLEILLDSRVVVSDLHRHNIVYAHSIEDGEHWVMIDGLGAANLLPLKEWFPSLNRRSKFRRIQRLKKKLAQCVPENQLIRELRP